LHLMIDMLLVWKSKHQRIQHDITHLLFPTLGCWQSDVYVSKYNIPTTNCATATNDASIFYTNANAIADYDNRLKHILSHKYTDGTPWSQLSVSKWYYWKEDVGRMLIFTHDLTEWYLFLQYWEWSHGPHDYGRQPGTFLETMKNPYS
jgi:hypothetical protein